MRFNGKGDMHQTQTLLGGLTTLCLYIFMVFYTVSLFIQMIENGADKSKDKESLRTSLSVKKLEPTVGLAGVVAIGVSAVIPGIFVLPGLKWTARIPRRQRVHNKNPTAPKPPD